MTDTALTPERVKAVLEAGSVLVTTDAEVLALFVAAFAADPGTAVQIEKWEEWVRDRENALTTVWVWKVSVTGSYHNYSAPEYLLDCAAPRFPQRETQVGYPDGAQNGPLRVRVGRMLGMSEVRQADGSFASTGLEPELPVATEPTERDPTDQATDEMTVLPLANHPRYSAPVAEVPEQDAPPPPRPPVDPNSDEFIVP